ESDDPERDVEEILKLGLKGVKLHHDFQGFGIDDRRCMRLYEICEGRLPVLMHTGDNRYDYSNPNRLKPVLEAFPDLTVIGAHLGGWSIWEQAANELCGFGNFYVDSSSSLYALTPEKAKELIRMYGADRVLYGDDFPMWPPAEELERFRKLGLTEQEQELILCRNAEKIFGIRLSNTDGGQTPADQRET
ncbi:MAG: amidohydrolase family protein, partial [Clostridia bacterium]|nr:amidohydrolase family protein [Clostridia bacterium]